ncbi:MAG TPA: hemerythrin domain-containing protein [Polyangia bacterium]|jgi:hemerythrin-like domain-containing protein|nr:hemerythrin domain-containing protein [Polyangia bacterium]
MKATSRDRYAREQAALGSGVMYNAATLLNEDGSASMATVLLMSHHAFRRDIARFAVALGQFAAGDASRLAALQTEWQAYRGALHGHHEVEDQWIFPDLRARQPDLVPVIDRLISQHRRIDPLLGQGDGAFANLPAGSAAAATVVAEISALLDEHLALEEANVIGFCARRRSSRRPPATPRRSCTRKGSPGARKGWRPRSWRASTR